MDTSERFAEAERLAKLEVPHYRTEPVMGAFYAGLGTALVIWLFGMFAGLDLNRLGLPAAALILLIAGGTWLYLRSIEQRFLAAKWKHLDRLQGKG